MVEREGIPCTDPTRTLIDLGAVVVDDILERALEDALRRGLTSVSRLRWRGRQLARPGRAGPAALRRVLERRPQGAPPTESDLETQFLQCLRAAGVREPVRQHRLQLTDGTMVRLDDAYPEELLFVELDGWASHVSRTAFRQDRRRQNQVVLLGWRPLRVHLDRCGGEARTSGGRGGPGPGRAGHRLRLSCGPTEGRSASCERRSH